MDNYGLFVASFIFQNSCKKV